MSWLGDVLGGGGDTKTYQTTSAPQTTTITSDLRQVAEGEIISGPESVLGMAGSTTLGKGATLNITGADPNEIVGSLLTNMDSTVAKLLGVQSQMAQGMFELAPKIIAEVKGFEATAPATNYMPLAIGGLVLLFLFTR